MNFTRNMKDECIVFYLQFINSREGLGIFFSSAALIRRLRKSTATITHFKTRSKIRFAELKENMKNFFSSSNFSPIESILIEAKQLGSTHLIWKSLSSYLFATKRRCNAAI